MTTANRRKKFRERIHRVELNFTDIEYNDFFLRATSENTTVGKLVKNMSIAYLRNETLPSLKELERLNVIQDELQTMSLYIRNIANNINQIAHRSNTLKVMVDERDFLLYLKSLDEELRTNIYKYSRNK